MAYSSIVKPSDYFDNKLYTGNGTSQTLDMDNLGLLWMKNRTEVSNHCLFDSVRGGYYTSAPGPILRSNGTTAAGGSDITSAYGITFGSSSSTIGSDGGGYNYNQNGKSYVGWQWRASGAGSANTDGSINSTVSANTTAGFSISKFTGTGANATVGHGLGVAPKMIIVKNLSDVDNWVVYHNSLGNTDGLYLNTTDSTVGTNTFWNNTTPTTTVFSVGTHNRVNGSGDNMIAYCFADVPGYSKIGSFTGNGNADGTFAYTGFRPAFILVRASNLVTNWHLYDNKRDPINPADIILRANSSNAEATNSEFAYDFVSNGFKARSSGSEFNGSGNTFIYYAVAEEPLVANSGSNGVPATAR